MFNVNNINNCAIRTLTESNVNGLSLVSSSGIYLAGVGHRVVTAHSAVKGCGIRITRRHVGSVGPSYRIAACQGFCAPRASTRFSFSRCSCIISTVSAMSNGVRLIVRTRGDRAPVVYSVNTNGGVSPATFRIASVCGASIYPLTEIVQCRLGGHKIGGLGIICSGRGPLMPVRSAAVDYHRRYVYPPNATEGSAREHTVPNDGTFIPSMIKLVVTNRIMGSLAGCETGWVRGEIFRCSGEQDVHTPCKVRRKTISP